MYIMNDFTMEFFERDRDGNFNILENLVKFKKNS